MTKFLNRIALLLSLLIGTSAALFFGLFAGVGSSGYGYGNNEELAMFAVVV